MINIKAFFPLFFTISICGGQIINISGTVKDSSGAKLAGATVKLEKAGVETTTGTDGRFTLFNNSTSLHHQAIISSLTQQFLVLNNGNLQVNITERTTIELTVYNLQGRIFSCLKKSMDAGSHLLALPRINPGVHLYSARIGNRAYTFKCAFSGQASGISAHVYRNNTNNSLLKQAQEPAVMDTDVIAVTKDEYLNYREEVIISDTSAKEIKMLPCAGTVEDADGNIYQTVTLGAQVWTVENLRTTKYNDGTAITLDTAINTWSNDTTKKFCYYDNTTNTDSVKRFGALYNWYTVNTGKLAPAGWHVPTDAEWDSLQNYLISHGYNWDNSTTDNMIAKSMASRTDWRSGGNPGAIGNNLLKNNASGFTGLPAGRMCAGGFTDIGYYSYWWSATESNAADNCNTGEHAWNRTLGYTWYGIPYDHLAKSACGEKNWGLSVRLVRN